MNEFPELRAALMDAAERQRRHVVLATFTDTPPTADRPPVQGSWWSRQLRVVILALGGLLVAAAVALAAAGVFSPGGPVAPTTAPNPSFDAVIPTTIRLLALRTPDPGGGPQWGLQLVSTTRGEVCANPGRVEHGLIGVLGRDRAFGDDGRLHPFARIAPFGWCVLPDARGHAFMSIGLIGLPASALTPGNAAPANGCRTDDPPPANRALLCPRSALRDVYYGLLGPDAVSVTYRTATGPSRTEQTARPDGAYLIVLPHAGGLQTTESVGVGLSGHPFVSVSYRDGSACRITNTRACQPVGYEAPHRTNLSAAEIRAPITARAVPARITGGPVLVNVSFTARVPVTSSHSYYELDVSCAKSPGCSPAVSCAKSPGCSPAVLQTATTSDIHAGQRIQFRAYVPPDVIHGTVRYVQANALAAPFRAGSPRGKSVLVGRFELNLLPRRPPH